MKEQNDLADQLNKVANLIRINASLKPVALTQQKKENPISKSDFYFDLDAEIVSLSFQNPENGELVEVKL